MPSTARGGQPVAVVTGGASGIGLAVVRGLAHDGYAVYVLDSSPPPSDFDAVALWAADDVRSPEGINGVLDRALHEHGRVDALCACAGIKTYGAAPETSLEDWKRVFDVNVTGTFLAVKAVLPTMIAARGGAIVTVGSTSAYGERGAAAYAASKGAVLALTRAVALDCRPHGVRANCVVPALTQTGMTQGVSEQQLRQRGLDNVAGRVNEPEDVAKVIAFLLSPAASTMSGAVLDVGRVQGEMAVNRHQHPEIDIEEIA
jgi:NAD(P)-dependent dehydrogenase (short-subunit alcohol dehydrogenase family)